ncbi:VOC family protein [Shewanella metallivivens]|uniref:VOC family protein n=1 Tax=Shewanella metallivivens TaxID=2872342 RepID=A0ABT5TM23_9GAMM|nr:VOC family protein [Shewanella metallivivens]MDD8058904.1 VOC family protein [Shewanella metallivivens]
MFSHVMIGVNDIEASKKFYDATLGALGIAPGHIDAKGRCFYMTPSGIFALTKPINGEPASHGNGTTIGFAAQTPELADAWHAAGVANGGTASEDAPGVRSGPAFDLYLAYLRDLDGNKLCALHRVAKD